MSRKRKLKDRMATAGQGIAAAGRAAQPAERAEPLPRPAVRSADKVEFILIPLDKVEENPKQPRKRTLDAEALEELAATIKAEGVLQPILVTPKGRGRFVVVAGHRRWAAAKLAGLEEIPAVVRQVEDLGKLALIENLQRTDLAPLEEALAVSALKEQHGYTQERVAAELGKGRTWVTAALSLLHLPGDIQKELLDEAAPTVSRSALVKFVERHKKLNDEEVLVAWEAFAAAGYTVTAARAQRPTTKTQGERRPRSSQLDTFSNETERYQDRVTKLLGRSLEPEQRKQVKKSLVALQAYIQEQLEQL